MFIYLIYEYQIVTFRANLFFKLKISTEMHLYCLETKTGYCS